MKLVEEGLTFRRGMSDDEVKTTILGKEPKEVVLEKLKKFKCDGCTVGVNKKGTPVIILKLDPGYLKLGKYDQAGWPNHVYSVEYTLTIIPDRDDHISVRKYWKGISGRTGHFDHHYFELVSPGGEKIIEDFYENSKNNKKDQLIDAVLLGRFKTSSEALERIRLNIEKEKKRKRAN
jgi:hypothetical protein